MSETTVSPILESSMVSTADKVDGLSQASSFCTTVPFDEDVQTHVRSLDAAFSPYPDDPNESIAYEKHEWRGTWVR